MGPERTRDGRVRAWVLVRAARAQEVTARLRNLDRGGDDFVVIRADVVAESPDFPYNIIVPVDAESEEVLSDAVDEIRGQSGVSEAIKVGVLEHHPYPPHDASGYITHHEAQVGERKPERVGRQEASPGFNPWG